MATDSEVDSGSLDTTVVVELTCGFTTVKLTLDLVVRRETSEKNTQKALE